MKRACVLGKRMAFGIFDAYKNRKAAGDSPRASHPNVAQFTGPCDRPCRTYRGAVQGTRPSGVRHNNRPKRMPERRHRRPELHGRIFRRPTATPRVALRRRRPLRAVPEPDRRPRPISRRSCDGSCRCRRPAGLALAIDLTTLSDRLRVIVASVVCRGCAIPVAWVAMPANKPGKWIEPAREPLTACRSPFPG